MLLGAVSLARRLTTRLPHRQFTRWRIRRGDSVSVFCLALPDNAIVAGASALAEEIPMKQYANLPFRVCVNDQLDRFSAPIENRYRRADVESYLGGGRWNRSTSLRILVGSERAEKLAHPRVTTFRSAQTRNESSAILTASNSGSQLTRSMRVLALCPISLILRQASVIGSSSGDPFLENVVSRSLTNLSKMKSCTRFFISPEC